MNTLNRVIAIAAAVLSIGTAALAAERAPGGREKPAQARQRGERITGERGERFIARGDRPADFPRDIRRPGPGGPGGPAGLPGLEEVRPLLKFWDNPETVEALSLTDSQVKALEESFNLTTEALEETQGSIIAAHDALRDALETDKPVLDDVNAAIDRLAAAASEKLKIATAHRVVVKNVLTPEQEEALREQRRERIERGPAGPIRERLREEIGELRDLVEPMLEDGAISEEEHARIETALADKPEVARKAALRAVEHWESIGHVPPPPPEPPRGPDGPRRGEGRKGPGADSRPLPDLP